MSKIIIGDRQALDLDVLVSSRMLIQASSGGGKSYLIRRMVEQMYGKIQVIIIDPEGEFATLRENFDFVLVGKGGETPADVRSASMLAERLLKLNVAAICDIYELPIMERHRWVRLFLEALINVSKDLWHQVIIVVDEAHTFAPEKGQGESEALPAMMDLASRGRKRGFCLVAATQRLGKFSKNVAAELQNVLIGRTFMDIDRKRAAETLGVMKTDEKQFFHEVKLLEPGFFYALGVAISTERIMFKVAAVVTSHPKVGGKYKATPPPPSERVKALLPQLSDLPAAAEQKARTEKELRAEISELKKQLKAVPIPILPPIPSPQVKVVEKKVISDTQIARLNKLLGKAEQLATRGDTLRDKIAEVVKELSAGIKEATPNKGYIMVGPGGKEKHFHPSKSDYRIASPSKIVTVNFPGAMASKMKFENTLMETSTRLLIGERKVLEACIQFKNGLERGQLTVLTGYKRSSRDAYIARLKEKGFVDTPNGRVTATKDGIAALPDAQPLPTGEDLQNYWLGRLPQGEKAILEILIQHHPGDVRREVLDEGTGYKRSSRDAYLSRLAAKELVVEAGTGKVKASENLF